ncbi:unnamed protein product [Acanthoscelides obtectus]|nr:unnamed protein product [Acanthoscelides obtectus]CAK1647092.1 Protein yellow [Acanthoscelides obtectus]
MVAGPRIFKNRVYVTMPKFRPGVPVTLGSFPLDSPEKVNIPISPFPNWEMNVQDNCRVLQSVLGTEVDRRGTMWVLDGHRANNAVNGIRCPPKLVLLDLNRNGAAVRSYTFPNELCLTDGGFLNDVVIDETGGTFAYITDNSVIDPGVIVYSYRENRAWKLRDGSMFPDVSVAGYIVDGFQMDFLGTVNGIALSPYIESRPRTLFYSSLTGTGVFALSTDILKNEKLSIGDSWREYVRLMGEKEGPSDGMFMDNKGNLYYGILSQYSVGKWNMFEHFDTSEVIYENRETLIWPDGFTMDSQGNLYLVSNQAFRFFVSNDSLQFTPDLVKFRINVLHTGRKSYMYDLDDS